MVHIAIKGRSKEAKAFLEYARKLPFVVIEGEEIEKTRYNAKTEKAIKDSRSGKGIIRAKNVDELLKKLLA